jgi:hypothetical protein
LRQLLFNLFLFLHSPLSCVFVGLVPESLFVLLIVDHSADLSQLVEMMRLGQQAQTSVLRKEMTEWLTAASGLSGHRPSPPVGRAGGAPFPGHGPDDDCLMCTRRLSHGAYTVYPCGHAVHTKCAALWHAEQEEAALGGDVVIVCCYCKQEVAFTPKTPSPGSSGNRTPQVDEAKAE